MYLYAARPNQSHPDVEIAVPARGQTDSRAERYRYIPLDFTLTGGGRQ
jgi:hypothetical protein